MIQCLKSRNTLRWVAPSGGASVASEARWCLEWYFHPEAVSRVEALWRAWEHLRLDGATGISVWFKDHADHHMSVLLDPRGCQVGF
jgi:hypothetical protein